MTLCLHKAGDVMLERGGGDCTLCLDMAFFLQIFTFPII